jgi:hypothetical protein
MGTFSYTLKCKLQPLNCLTLIGTEGGCPDAGARLCGNHANPKVATFCSALWLTFALPLTALEESFSRPGCGRIFPLYSRVMRGGLLTGVGAGIPGSVLSGLIFSGPVACADLVNFL